MLKLHIKKGDQVVVISGEERGKEGKVLSVETKDNVSKAIVEGINLVSKHTKPNAKHPQGGIIKKEAPLHISNLMLVDKNGKGQRIGRKKNEDGKSVRFFKKTGEVIK